MLTEGSQRQAGFSLLELMIVVAIIGLLAGVAYPAYQQQIIKTRRAEATATLMATAQDLERCFTRYAAYNDAACGTATRAGGAGIGSEEGHYLVTGAIDAVGYTLTATPQGAQANDSKCLNFTLTETGTRGVSGTEAADKCW